MSCFMMQILISRTLIYVNTYHLNAELNTSDWRLNLHEVVRPVVGYGGESGRRWRCWWDAVGVEAAVDLEVHHGVPHGAVDAVPSPALARLPRDCRHNKLIFLCV